MAEAMRLMLTTGAAAVAAAAATTLHTLPGIVSDNTLLLAEYAGAVAPALCASSTGGRGCGMWHVVLGFGFWV